jgi:hypothetical protein
VQSDEPAQGRDTVTNAADQPGTDRQDRPDDSVEGHRIVDTGELHDDDTVEGHAVNHRPLDNGVGGNDVVVDSVVVDDAVAD